MAAGFRLSIGGLKRTSGWRMIRGIKRKLLPPTLAPRPAAEWRGAQNIPDPPIALEAGRHSDWRIRVMNSGPDAFPAEAVAVTGQWTTRQGSAIGDRVPFPLPRPVFSGEASEFAMRIPAPEPVGDFQLELRLSV